MTNFHPLVSTMTHNYYRAVLTATVWGWVLAERQILSSAFGLRQKLFDHGVLRAGFVQGVVKAVPQFG